MSFLKPYSPSADYVVTQAFFEQGNAYKVGDDYVPRFNSHKRKFRHYVARRIVVKDVVVEEVVEEIKVVEPVKTKPAKVVAPQKRKTKTQVVDSK